MALTGILRRFFGARRREESSGVALAEVAEDWNDMSRVDPKRERRMRLNRGDRHDECRMLGYWNAPSIDWLP